LIIEKDDEILFDFSMDITEGMISDIERLFELLRLLESSNNEKIEDAKFNSYIQVRIRSFNLKKSLMVEEIKA
jgi:hypothetical protein